MRSSEKADRVYYVFGHVSFQIDPDKTKSSGAKFQDDTGSDNASFVSMSSCVETSISLKTLYL